MGQGALIIFLSYLDKFSDTINKMMWICPTDNIPGVFQTGALVQLLWTQRKGSEVGSSKGCREGFAVALLQISL